jgi:hypothetical protein
MTAIEPADTRTVVWVGLLPWALAIWLVSAVTMIAGVVLNDSDPVGAAMFVPVLVLQVPLRISQRAAERRRLLEEADWLPISLVSWFVIVFVGWLQVHPSVQPLFFTLVVVPTGLLAVAISTYPGGVIHRR